MQKITTFLWYDGRAEEAVALYTSLFAGSRVVHAQSNVGGGPDESETVLVIEFELAGQRFLALNGGPQFTFTEAMSLSVDCGDQEEVDRLSAGLIAGGGEQGPCGWLKDRFGVSWQIVPRVLPELLADPDTARAARVMKAMMGMQRIDIQGLLDAAAS